MILRDGRLVTSYSQISKFKQCPYSWELQYIDKIHFDTKSKHLEYGLAVHETLEYVFNLIKDNSFPDDNLSALKESVIDLYYNQLEEREVPFDSEEEKEEWIQAGLDMIDSLLNKETDFDKLITESEILGVELPFELPIEIEPTKMTDKNGEIKVYDKVWVIGFIDLVLRTPEGIIVVDHKSGGKKFDKAKLRENLQFPIYALAIKQLFGEYPVKAYYNFTRIHTSQELLIKEEVTYEMEDIMNKRSPKQVWCISPEKAEMEMMRIFNKMKCKIHPANPQFLCNYCDHNVICSNAYVSRK